jgi:hypothetical protein
MALAPTTGSVSVDFLPGLVSTVKTFATREPM